MRKLNVNKKDILIKIRTESDDFVIIVGENVYTVKNKGENTGFLKDGSSSACYLLKGEENDDKYCSMIQGILELFKNRVEGRPVTDDQTNPIKLGDIEYLYDMVNTSSNLDNALYIFL